MRRLVAAAAGALVGRMPSAGETPERKVTRTRMVLLRARASCSEHEVRAWFLYVRDGGRMVSRAAIASKLRRRLSPIEFRTKRPLPRKLYSSPVRIGVDFSFG